VAHVGENDRAPINQGRPHSQPARAIELNQPLSDRGHRGRLAVRTASTIARCCGWLLDGKVFAQPEQAGWQYPNGVRLTPAVRMAAQAIDADPR
jgi:hypothetical protein